MIPRYSRPQMAAIWEPQNRYRIWFEIEAHACDALALQGVIPKSAAATIWKKGKFDADRIDEIERTTKHDVIAFLTNVAEHIGPDARFLHQGMTSSDVLDTCLAVQLKEASDLLLADIDALLKVLKRRALETKNMVCVGRSHGIHAEPTTFGIKMARFYAEFTRCRERLVQARKEIATCAISGAVGTFANIAPFVEDYVAKKLGLAPEPVSSQVIPRDRHAAYFSTLAVIAGSVENIATEIRHLQRTEVLEAEEYFSPGQKGSSAMPHKRNPVLSENLCGLARMVRAYALPALESVALWHERDISHSSVERMIGPDATVTLDFALTRLTDMMDRLIVYPENMQRNLDKLGGLIFSQRVLLALTQAGLSREESYGLVQRIAMKVWEQGKDFLTDLLADKQVTKVLKPADIKKLFDLSYHTAQVDTIFKRVFGKVTPMYNLIDQLLPFLFGLSFLAMLLFIVEQIRRIKSRVKEVKGYGYTRPYPVKSAALFVLTMLSMITCSLVLQAEARREIGAYFSGLDMATLKVDVNGAPVVDPAAVLDTLRMKESIAAHHSHPINRITVNIFDKNGGLELWLGRDSDRPQEYWVFYPHYHTTSNNEAYRINTAIFDKY